MQLLSLEHHWEGSISNHGIARQAATFSAQWKSLPIAHWSSKSHVSLRSEFQRVRLQKNSVEKLCRWASKFQGFRYIIKHLPGDDNLWADMLCRWIPKPFKARTVALLQRDFSLASIIEMQQLQEQSSTGSLEITSSDGVLMFMDKVWVPDANNLRLQICIVEHCGTAGHLYFEGTQRRVVLLRIFRRGYQIFMRQLHSMHSQWQAIYPSNCGRSSTWKGTEPSSSLRVSLYSGEAQAQQRGVWTRWGSEGWLMGIRTVDSCQGNIQCCGHWCLRAVVLLLRQLTICLALSTELESPFQTMSVRWHHYKNSWNAVKGKPNRQRPWTSQGFL